MIFESYFWAIYAAALFTAIVSATVGMLGGTMLVAFLAQYLKADVLIPLHGIIQLSANGSRVWILRKFVNKTIAKQMIAGVILGGTAGYFYRIQIDEKIFNVVLGIFILAMTFAPKFSLPMQIKGKWFVVGFIACSIGLFFGAVGTFVGAVFLAEKLQKQEMVSTQAIGQVFVHLAKIIVFSLFGFAIVPWGFLIIGTIAMTFLGSFIGTRILDKIPDKTFRMILHVIIVVLSARLIYVGIKT